MFLLATASTEGQLPAILVGAIGASLVSGVYSFANPLPLAAVDFLQSNGTQLALVGASGLNLLVSRDTGLLSVLLLGFMAVEAYTSCNMWLSQNSRRLVG